MAIIRWLGEEDSAFGEMDRWQREMERWYSFFRPGFGSLPRGNVYPSMNVYDDGESFIVRAEVPGVDPKNLDVSVVQDTLTIKGKREIPPLKENASYHRQERESGEFRRAFTLPDRVEANQVHAEVKNGILEIRLPRAVETKPRRIEVKAH